jgi:hypothetical protein
MCTDDTTQDATIHNPNDACETHAMGAVMIAKGATWKYMHDVRFSRCF